LKKIDYDNFYPHTKTQRSKRIMLYVQGFSLLHFLCGSVSLCKSLKKCKLLIVLYERRQNWKEKIYGMPPKSKYH